MRAVPMSVEEERWRAEEDARTLARAEEIKADAKRHAKAVAQAQAMLNEQNDRLKSLKKIAGSEPSKKTSRGKDMNAVFYDSFSR